MARFSSTPHTLALAGTLLLLSLPAWSAPMGPVQVRAMAESWAAHSAGIPGGRVSALQPLAWSAQEPVFYLATFQQGGWLLATADNDLFPVVGWSTSGLPTGELPPALLDRLQAEEQAVLAMRAAQGSCEGAAEAWNALLTNRGAERAALRTDPSDVAPMVEAHWGQGSAYNTDCPSDNAGPGGHAYVGCVGVAIAQVMDYWNWPEQGEFIQSYYHEVYGDIGVDFNQVFYNWEAITPAQSNDAVKELLYHAGVSVRMNYGPSSSTAQTSMISSALRTYFRYQDTARMVWRSSYTQDTWHTMLHSELAAGRPVIYRGQGNVGGHAFNLDGVQDSTWFHINWGWGGNYDGYFTLDDLTPGSYSFNSVQGAVIGIAPDGQAVNHQPLVPGLYHEISENQTISVTLSGYDQDGDALTYRVNGVTLPDNTWSWTPPANTHGTFSFSYQACDQSGCSQPADIIVVVHNVNQLPVVAAIQLESLEDEALSIQLAASDADGDSLTYLVNGQAIDGNHFQWTPPANAQGDFSFTYTACDEDGCGNTALLVVSVLPVNDAPQAQGVTLHILEPGVQYVQLAAWDVDGDGLTYYVDGVAQDGDIFTVDAQLGADLDFDFWASDGQLCSDTVSVVLTFAPKGPGKEYLEPANFSNRSQITEGLAVETPSATTLRPAYPNPFNPATTLPIELAATSRVRLSIYNVAGQRVTVLTDEVLEAGRHDVRWNASALASGAYLAVLESEAGMTTQFLHLIK
jgi:hypothetical protein